MTGPWSRWHNVESLDPVNLSVNYWWVDGPLAGPVPYLPRERRGMLGDMSP